MFVSTGSMLQPDVALNMLQPDVLTLQCTGSSCVQFICAAHVCDILMVVAALGSLALISTTAEN